MNKSILVIYLSLILTACYEFAEQTISPAELARLKADYELLKERYALLETQFNQLETEKDILEQKLQRYQNAGKIIYQ